MTRDDQLKCIEHNLTAFKKMVLAKASKVPSNWEDAEIRQSSLRNGVDTASLEIPDGVGGWDRF